MIVMLAILAGIADVKLLQELFAAMRIRCQYFDILDNNVTVLFMMNLRTDCSRNLD